MADVTLSFHTDLWRVQIAGSDWPDGQVLIERSQNGNIWEPVRGGRTLPVEDGTFSLNDYDGYATGVTNHYRVTMLVTETHDDPGSQAWTVPADIDGDLDVQAWGSGAGGHISDSGGGTDQTGRGGGGGGAFASATVEVTAEESLTVEVGAGGEVVVGQSRDGEPSGVYRSSTALVEAAGGSEPTSAGGSGAGGAAAASTGDVTRSGGDGGSRESSSGHGGGGGGAAGPGGDGQDGADGTASAAGAGGSGSPPGGDGGDGSLQASGGTPHTPADDGQAPGGGGGGQGDQRPGDDLPASGDGADGRVVLGYTLRVQDSIVPAHDRIVLKHVEHPSGNRPVTVTDWSTPTRRGRAGIHEVKNRPRPIGVHDLMSSPSFTLELMTDTAEQERVMDLVLAMGGVLLLHVPPDCPVPGGYLLATATDGPRRETPSARTTRRYWDLSCRVADPPDADVQTALVTWHTLELVYGSWEAVWAAHSSWLDLWQTVFDPGEVLPL